MLGLDGKWHDNSHCRACRHRHPPGWSCTYAAFVASRHRQKMAKRAQPDTTNFFFREAQDPWEHFIQENYPS